MRICFALLYYDPQKTDADPAVYLSRIGAARYLPRALAALGHDIDVVHLYPVDAHYRECGVHHHFVAPGRAARGVASGLGLLGQVGRPHAELAWRSIRRLQSLAPAVVHFLGSTLHVNLAALTAALRPTGPPIVLHHQGGDPAEHPLARRLQRFSFDRASRICFGTAEQAATYIAAGLLRDGRQRVVDLMGNSSPFSPAPRDDSRRHTGMTGAPVFLWAGRLETIKDPLTALRGFERIAREWTRSHLYLHYLTDTLLPELQAWVRQRPELSARIHFRGRLAFERMEAVYNSADFLLQASYREHGGNAVLDAMACGVIPVVTDIPSFRAMTGNGAAGVLFARGDDESLARRVLAMDRDGLAARAVDVRRRFEQVLSFAALARTLDQVDDAVRHERSIGSRSVGSRRPSPSQ